MKEVEGRAEGAGMENGVGRGMPVYWIEVGGGSRRGSGAVVLVADAGCVGVGPSAWDEIVQRVRPKTLVVVSTTS
jgi:hypothetical protein